MTTATITRLSEGSIVTLRMPWSEVCMSMHISDLVCEVQLLRSGMAQVWRAGERFSAPITAGEAGVLRDSDGWYVSNAMPPLSQPCKIAGCSGRYDLALAEEPGLTGWWFARRDDTSLVHDCRIS